MTRVHYTIHAPGRGVIKGGHIQIKGAFHASHDEIRERLDAKVQAARKDHTNAELLGYSERPRRTK